MARGINGTALARSNDPEGSPLYVLRTTFTTSDDTKDIPVQKGLRVIDFWVVVTTAGGGSGTARLSDTSNNITDAVTCDVLDTIGRAATIDQTYATLGAGDTLRVTLADDPAGEAFIVCLREDI